MSKVTVSAPGVGLSGALFLVFLVLKLTGYIDWSWFYVTLPLWAGLAVVAGVAALLGAIYGGACLLDFFLDRRIRARRKR
jgi:hypothetical protein